MHPSIWPHPVFVFFNVLPICHTYMFYIIKQNVIIDIANLVVTPLLVRTAIQQLAVAELQFFRVFHINAEESWLTLCTNFLIGDFSKTQNLHLVVFE